MGFGKKGSFKEINGWFYRIIVGFLKPFIMGYFRLKTENASIIPKKGAAILIGNHVNFFDPIWLYVMAGRPVYFVATEDLFRHRFIGILIRWFGGFPKRKAANDFRAMHNIFDNVKKGRLIGIFPEGNRTWDGLNGEVIPTIARLVRKLKVPVYVCRLDGGYLAFPRWAKWWRRIPVTGVFSQLYSSEDIPESDEVILRDIEQAIKNRDYELNIDVSRYHHKKLAIDITKLLYRCPVCGTMEGLKLVKPYSKNMVECSSCFSAWRVTVDARLEPLDETGNPEGPRIPIYKYAKSIRNMPLVPIRTEVNLHLEEGERIFLKSRPKFIFIEERFPNIRVLAFGSMILTNRHLIFRTRLGIPLRAELKAIESLSIEPGDKLHFVYDGVLYRLPFKRESVVKWYDTIVRLQREITQNGSSDNTYHQGVSPH